MQCNFAYVELQNNNQGWYGWKILELLFGILI